MTTQIQIQTETEATAGLSTNTNTLVAQARAVVIVDEQSLNTASTMLVNVKRLAKDVEADKEKIYRPAKQVLDEITRRYKPMLDTLAQAEDALKRTIGTWQQEQARIAEQKRQAEIREREEAALKAAQEAEAERLKQEAAVKAQAEAEAARLAAEGKAEAAAAVTAAADATLADIKAEAEKATSVMIDQTAKVESSFAATTKTEAGAATTRMVWDFEVTDIKQLPADLLIADTAAIRRLMQGAVAAGQTPSMAGLRFYQKPSVAVRL